jgi:hypothetical protein
MIKIIMILFRALAVLLIGFFCAVVSAIVVINLGYGFAPDFTYNGWEGYEAHRANRFCSRRFDRFDRK